MDERISFGFYSVAIEGNQDRAIVDVKALAEALPHGSGLDTDWHMTVHSNGSVTCQTEYHTMDEYGGYAGWIPVRFILRKATDTREHALTGPCEGQTQVLYRKGDMIGRFTARAEHADYLFDCVSCALAEAGIKPVWWE